MVYLIDVECCEAACLIWATNFKFQLHAVVYTYYPAFQPFLVICPHSVCVKLTYFSCKPLMIKQGDFASKKQAARVTINVTIAGRTDQIAYCSRCGAIGPLCDMLTVTEAEVITSILYVISKFLQVNYVSYDANHG